MRRQECGRNEEEPSIDFADENSITGVPSACTSILIKFYGYHLTEILYDRLSIIMYASIALLSVVPRY